MSAEMQTLTPHVSTVTACRPEQLHQEVIWNIVEYLKTGMPVSPVNADELAKNV